MSQSSSLPLSNLIKKVCLSVPFHNYLSSDDFARVINGCHPAPEALVASDSSKQAKQRQTQTSGDNAMNSVKMHSRLMHHLTNVEHHINLIFNKNIPQHFHVPAQSVN